ncbi:TPA: ABC-2 transporter permease [Bacillus toyonensis]|nr:ABC-2 transporter permease [Bacillus toyonensis]
MLINLVVKDILLVKKYFSILLVFAAIAPIYLSTQLQLNDGGLIGFLLTVVFMEHILFSTISKFEDQYKGAALLCATPYTRSAFVKAKYLFLLVVFLCASIIRMITSIIMPSDIENLSINALGITFLVVSILFGILLPFQFEFGFDKTRMISFIVVFLIPFVAPTLIKEIQLSHLNFTLPLPFPSIIMIWMPFLISIVISIISMIISLKVFATKEL